MHIPAHFEEQRLDVLQNILRLHPLATLIIAPGSELAAVHLPMVLEQRGPLGTLVGHVARANPIWQQFGELAALAIFQGPQAYISPSWYPSKQDHGKVVPTWNYVVVHVRGTPRALEDRDWLLSQVTRMTEQMEGERELPWKVADAPVEYIERMLGGIVGVELPIVSLRGSWKLSQNRSLADRLGVAAGLEASEDSQTRAMGDLVR